MDTDFQKEVPFRPFETPVAYEQARERAEQILDEMTLEEKIAMIGGYNVFYTKGYEKWGIPSVRFGDATQGVRMDEEWVDLDKSVAFPAPICLTSTWNRDVAREYAKSIGEECRAADIAVLLGPGMNIYRMSQYGRNFEYFGEDPFLAARMIENYVLGVQSTGTGATLKHFVANNSDHRRRTSNSVVGERALHEIYMPAFEAGVNAGVTSVMMAYNLLNGEYCPQSEYVVSKLLREDLGFKWLVMSDWVSIWDAEKALKSGMDLDMPGSTDDGIYSEDDHAKYLRREAPALIEAGKVSEADIDPMVRNILTTLIALGLTERPVKDASFVENYDQHIAAALETAREGIVMLRNEQDVLPFKPADDEVILVTGPFVDVRASGRGSGYVDGFDSMTLLDALRVEFGERVQFISAPTDEEIRSAALVICTAGTEDSEGNDVPFDLPQEQNDLIAHIANLNDKTVIAIYAGAGRNMSSWNEKVATILYCWYPGQIGNQAVAEIIAGKVNPSGKLPITIEKRFEESPGYGYLPKGEELYEDWEFDMDMDHPVHDIVYEEGVFIGYRWYEKKDIEPLYPFGHGLSYSRFNYSKLRTSSSRYDKAENVQVKVDVTNSGELNAKEIVQLYVRDIVSSVERPIKELKDFQKLQLAPGEKKTCFFTLTPRDFAFWDEGSSDWKVEAGEFEILTGTSSADIRATTKITLY